MPSHIKGSRRKHSRLVLQFARGIQGTPFNPSLQVNGPHCYLPIIWLLERDIGEVETVTLKIKGHPSRAVDSVLMGTDLVGEAADRIRMPRS